MDQAHWIALSDARIAEANSLLNGGFWAGAYYLAGYAVECRLKALVVKRIAGDPGIIFIERKLQEDVWTHDYKKLLERSDLKRDLDRDSLSDPHLRESWNKVFGWSEAIRYGFPGESKARELLVAVRDPHHGVLTWLDKYL